MKSCSPESFFTLSNGSFESSLNALGNGYLRARECFLTSYRPSPDDGLFFFIRDTESGEYWTSTPAPTFVRPESFRMEVGERTAHIERTDHSIRTDLDILVPEAGDFELRRLTLSNLGASTRRLEITSSVDVILLFDRLRDSYHQTFSNMFIGAEFSEDQLALIYHRRSFDNPTRFPFFMHRIFLDSRDDFLGFETDRESFVGRGQPFGRPLAINRPLRNTSGYILDPLANLRTALTLEPGETPSVFFSNSAHFPPEQPEVFFVRFPSAASVEQFFVPEFDRDQPSRKESPCDLDVLDPETPIVDRPTQSPFPDTETLLFWNGFGGFDPTTHDYHLRVRPKDLPPQPWANILANANFGTMTTENSLGTTWFKNSKHGRLTPWSNNPVSDPPAEILFARKKDGETWSLTPSPLPASDEYHVTHGRGFTKYECFRGNVRSSLTVSVHPEKATKYLAIEFENTGDDPTSIDLLFFMDLPEVAIIESDLKQIPPKFDPEENAIFLDPSIFSPFPDKESVRFHAALSADCPIRLVSRSKRQLFGVSGSLSAPKPIPDTSNVSDPESIADACIAIEASLSLAPRKKYRVVFSVFAGTTGEELRALLRSEKGNSAQEEAFSLKRVSDFWKERTLSPSISTPEKSLDILFNSWLPYQSLVSRMWAKMGFYQPGGAFGFRDQLQDAIALRYIAPAMAKRHILDSAAQQFEDGNVRAWWSPDSGFGVKNGASDHPVWLPWAVAEYVRRSGDTAILDEKVPFLVDDSDEPTRFDVKRHAVSPDSASLLDHALRAIEYVSDFGAHGLPIIRSGDWNDGFNRVGNEGKGESVWLGFFLFSVLESFADILSERDAAKSEIHRKRAAALKKNLNSHGWDGHWFLRAFYDDGAPLGSESNHECRIDAIAQTWSVLSGAGNPAKSREAMENLWHFLYDPESKILHLLDPPFNDLSRRNPGYIKDYPPGIRENGSQYNHAVFWAAEAFAALGNADRAFALLECANPILRSDSEDAARLYEVEPYVVAADIYSAEHRGKGGWTWYTASAGLLYRTLIETIFGIRFEGEFVSVRPALPSAWTQCSITFPRATGDCTFSFSARKNHANVLRNISLDGLSLAKDAWEKFPIPADGHAHRLDISLE